MADELRVKIAELKGWHIVHGSGKNTLTGPDNQPEIVMHERDGRIYLKVWSISPQGETVVTEKPMETLADFEQFLPDYTGDPKEWLALMAERNIALLPVAIYTAVDEYAIGVEPHTTKWVAFSEDLDWVPWKKEGDWLGQIDAEFDPEEMYDTPGEAICRLWLRDQEIDNKCKEGITNG